MPTPPTGTITFLFTDLERSAHQWEQRPEAMERALARHDALVRDVLEAHGGSVFKTVGDAFHAAYSTAPAALRAAVAIQRALAAEPWETGEPLRARMALHTGTAQVRDSDYFGPTLNRVGRLRDAGYGGQILLSAVTAGLVRAQVPEGVELRDLGVHRLRDLAEPERVYQAAVWGLAAEFPPLRTEDERLTNLPSPLTSFVGRDREIDDVVRLLDAARLVTLTGPGGTGKTRLALAVADQVQDTYPDGVWFVDLSPITDAALVASMIAQALSVREGEGPSLSNSVKAYLRGKRLLLLLDNFEQVIDAASLVRDLLTTSPSLTVLVTSRVPLRLSGEREYPVPPLPVPDPSARDGAAVAGVPSVALFVQRAQDVKPDFALTTENAAAVADVCARLDGLPLAIELAAARLRVLSPEGLRDRLRHRLAVLTGGGRDAPARQQTLRNTMQWSYDLLTPDEQTLFRHLAVFVGGCTLEAAEAVCRAVGGEVDGTAGHTVLDGVTSLVEKSLLRLIPPARRQTEPRVTMLETVREFARERLETSSEADALKRQHAAYFLELAETADVQLMGAQQQAWLARLEAEHDNLRAAFAWCAEQRADQLALRLVGALAWYWIFSGHRQEGKQWATTTLTLADPHARTTARAKALYVAGLLAEPAGNRDDDVRALLGESITIFREAGERRWLGRALTAVSLVETDPSAARAVLAESEAIFRDLGDVWGLALTLLDMAFIARDANEAHVHFQASLALFREVGNTWFTAACLVELGNLAVTRGDDALVKACFAEAAPLFEAAGDRRRVAAALHVLAYVLPPDNDTVAARTRYEAGRDALRGSEDWAGLVDNIAAHGLFLLMRGEVDRATALVREALSANRAMDRVAGIAACLQAMAGIVHLRRQYERAARLFGAGEALRERTGTAIPRSWQTAYQQSVEILERALGPDAFTAAWNAGRALSLDAAIALALEQTTAD